MTKRRQKDPPATTVVAPSAGPAPQREFAFSRIAGASPGDYAAVSSLAVVALALAVGLGWLGLLWVWWLIVPGVSLGMAMLAMYHIATSAGTLTGRRIALTAVAVSLALGLAGGILQLARHRQQQGDIARVRELAGQVCRHVQAGDFAAVYQQLAPTVRDAITPGQWQYCWQKTLREAGRISRVELSDRTLVAPNGNIVATMKLHFEPIGQGGSTRTYSVRLIYAQAMDGQPDEEVQAEPARQSDQPWELALPPDFVTALSFYPEALTWPSPGQATLIIKGQEQTYKVDGRSPLPTVPPGQDVSNLVDEHLAPKPPFERPWLVRMSPR